MKRLDPEFRDLKPQLIGSDHLMDPELHNIVNKTQLAEYYGWSLDRLRKELTELQPYLQFDVIKKRSFTTGQIMRIADLLGVPNNYYKRKSS